ncbi:phosphoribosyltransferase [Flexivirga oryzae]|uniref:Putative phosphoribosyltransferase n=1 Tax=Flexivirga oryzae TaxID=1794944 RepID=A0A839MY68_9MICO|nr:phosphoribosyltransferase family protein [Flexivirga oryzae]MBB2890390.1 putative phosphoribosyltransferase [Flexivirga oryzae]
MTRPGDREPYADRAAAGAAVADALADLAGRPDVVVLGLPRGGVPVAAVVARRLSAPLDVLVVRKLGLPRHPELAMGAVAGSAGELQLVRNAEVIGHGRVRRRAFEQVLRAETAELRRREALYRGARAPLRLRGRTVVVVDDGLATGASMRVAVRVIHQQEAALLVVAVPIGPVDVCAALATEVDRLVCPWTPADFVAVGAGYREFGQTPDDEVRRLLGVVG